MRKLCVAAGLVAAFGSMEGCVAATRVGGTAEVDAGVDAPSGSDARPGVDAPMEAQPPTPEGGPADSGARPIGPFDSGHMDSAKEVDATPTDAPPPDALADAMVDAPPVDTGPLCEGGTVECGGACVDTSTDTSHCGSCITVCSPPAEGTATCSSGVCGFTCESGFHACGAACADDTSVDSCGTSCTPCAVPVNAVASCDGTTCGFTCDAGSVLCAGGTACCQSNVVAGGDKHTCWLDIRSTLASPVTCWGLGSSGQLGNGSTSSTPIEDPEIVSGVSWSDDVVSVVAGYDHTCMLTSGGAVYCWGDDSEGDLGDGLTTLSSTLVPVSGLSSGVIGITAGQFHTCALLAAGTVECWGSNESGQLGNGSTGSEQTTPATVTGLAGVARVAAGGDHTCAVTGAGDVWCWGDGEQGQLGSASGALSSVPVKVSATSGLSGAAVAVTAGSQHTCALTSSGTVWCWGYGADGELGNGSIAGSSTPVAVASGFGASTVVSISSSASGSHTCALTQAALGWCWGGNGSGELGDGTTTNRATPVQVLAIIGLSALGTGAKHSCASVGASAHYCWGSDDEGQLGDGSTTNADTPQEVLIF